MEDVTVNDDSRPTQYAIIIGAMKAGTSNLYLLLGQHPQIATSREKEPNFFADEAQYRAGLKHYERLFQWCSDTHKVALEASTAYTKFPRTEGAAPRIAAAFPSVRLIYMMRHPIERIESHVRQGLYQGFSCSLDEGFRGEEINITRYATQIDQYVAVLPLESLLLLTLEEFREQPKEVLAQVCRHLGVDDRFEFSGVDEVRHAGSVYDRRRVFFRFSSRRLRPLQPLFLMVRSIARRIFPQKLRSAFWRSVVTADRGRYRLNDAEKQAVLDELRPDLERLQSVYGVDTQRYWGIPCHPKPSRVHR